MKLRWRPQTHLQEDAPHQDQLGHGATSLAFVHLSHPEQMKDRSNARKVRRHVMKDIGKSRRRDTLRTMPLSTIPRYQPPVPSYFGAMKICRHFRQIFLALGLGDNGALRLALANTALEYSHNVAFELQARVIEDYTEGLGAVRNKIVHTRNATDQSHALATAVCLAFYDMRVRNFRRWAMHIDGLKTILQFSGGLDDLESYHILQEALFMADVAGALVFDTQVSFSRPDQLAVYEPPSLAVLRISANILHEDLDQVNKLSAILNSLSYVATLLSHPPESPAMGATKLSRAAFSLAYDLLALPKLHTPIKDDPSTSARLVIVTEAVKRGALAFVSCVLTTSCDDDLYCARHRRGYLKPILLHTDDSDWAGMEDLRLWVLVMGALSEKGEDQAWLVERVAEQMRVRDLRSWGNVIPLLRQFAWCDALAVYETGILKRDLHNCLEDHS